MTKRKLIHALHARTSPKKNARPGKKAKSPAKPVPTDHVADTKLTIMSDSLLSPEFRVATYIDHREFAQSDEVVESKNDDEMETLDGVEFRVDAELEEVKLHGALTGFYETIETVRYRFAESYRVELDDGEVFVGDYKGNHRRIPTGYNADDAPMMRTWQVFLRDVDIEDDEKDESLDRMFSLDQCEPMWEFGEKFDEANTRRRLIKEPEAVQEREITVPVRPPIGFSHDHPDYGRGTVIECDSHREGWTVGVEFDWGDTIEEGQDVCRHFTRGTKKEWKARERAGEDLGERTGVQMGTVILVEKRHVTVEYYEDRDDDAGYHIPCPEERFTKSVFRRRFNLIRTYSSESFYGAFGLEPPGYRDMVIGRTLKRDYKSHNERIFSSGTESSMQAIAELTQVATPGLMNPFTGTKRWRRIRTGARGGAKEKEDPKIAERRRKAEEGLHWKLLLERQCVRDWINWTSLGLDAVMDIWTPPPPPPLRDGEPVGDLNVDDINGGVTLF